MQYHGWAESKAGVMKMFIDGMCSSRFVPNDDLKVTRRGTVAWTTVTFQISAKLKAGGSLELDGRHTAIWERRGEKWLIVHEHLSFPLPGSRLLNSNDLVQPHTLHRSTRRADDVVGIGDATFNEPC